MIQSVESKMQNNVSVETVEEILTLQKAAFLSHPFTFDIANKHFTTKYNTKMLNNEIN